MFSKLLTLHCGMVWLQIMAPKSWFLISSQLSSCLFMCDCHSVRQPLMNFILCWWALSSLLIWSQIKARCTVEASPTINHKFTSKLYHYNMITFWILILSTQTHGHTDTDTHTHTDWSKPSKSAPKHLCTTQMLESCIQANHPVTCRRIVKISSRKFVKS